MNDFVSVFAACNMSDIRSVYVQYIVYMLVSQAPVLIRPYMLLGHKTPQIGKHTVCGGDIENGQDKLFVRPIARRLKLCLLLRVRVRVTNAVALC